ncbi:hypothetical protein [Sphingomonas panacisoli]|uniref:hypothetical protein n=1 Tax=Sphingomonas panacisoli TaxID=1813879 RepID=UPI00164523F7|nr:hypothetical protein [Sphingomonas panacisoli]
MTRAAGHATHHANSRFAPAVDPFESDRARRHDAEQGSRLLLERIEALVARRARELGA